MTNILLITADDLDVRTPDGFSDGTPPAGVTPNIDRLGTGGRPFARAHVAAAVCQPSRSAITTGRWPHRNGAEGFGPIDAGVPLLTDLLRQRTYLTGILGKVQHLQPVDRFGWDLARDQSDLGMGRDATRYREAAEGFFARAAAEQRPWFLMANTHDPHRPFHGSADELATWDDQTRQRIPAPSRVYHADEVAVPGFLPDLGPIRQEYAEYLSSARRCDDVAGAVLSALDAAGQTDDTMIIFLSDNGMAFPFAKANCYLRSTRTPLIINWPGQVAPSVDQDHFVSAMDLFPTICEAAGLPIPNGLDGRTLLPLLSGRDDPGREQVFTVFHETSAKRRYEMRCVQDAEYGYVWNAWAGDGTAYRAENMAGSTWPAMLAEAQRNASVAARTDFYLHRAPEELYDLAADPDCLVNLAADPRHSEALAARRDALRAWMTDTADPIRSRY